MWNGGEGEASWSLGVPLEVMTWPSFGRGAAWRSAERVLAMSSLKVDHIWVLFDDLFSQETLMLDRATLVLHRRTFLHCVS